MADKQTGPDESQDDLEGQEDESQEDESRVEEDDETWFDGKPFTAQVAKKLVADLRADLKEFKKLKKDYAALDKRLKEIDDAELTEVDRLKKQLDEAQAERDEAMAKARQREVENVLREAGVIYPELAVDRLSDEALEDEDVLKSELSDLKKRYPAMFATNGSADGGEGGGRPKPVNDMNSRILTAMRRGRGRS